MVQWGFHLDFGCLYLTDLYGELDRYIGLQLGIHLYS